MASHRTTPQSGAGWVLDRGRSTEMGIDGIEIGFGERALGESYTYTLGFRDAWRSPGDRSAVLCFNELLERGRYAGRYTIHSLIDSRPKYTPEWPSGSPSLLVSLEPTGPNQRTTPGLWGLLESVEVNTQPTTADPHKPHIAVLDVTITYLADIDEFDTREELTTALEYDGLF